MADDKKHIPVNSEATDLLLKLLREALERDPAEPRPPHPGSEPAIGKIEITLPGPEPRNPCRRRLPDDTRPPGPNLGRRREDRGEQEPRTTGATLMHFPMDEILDVLESVDRVPLTLIELRSLLRMAIQLKAFGLDPAWMLWEAVNGEAALIRFCGREAVRTLTFDAATVLDGRPIDFAAALEAPSFRNQLKKLMLEAANPLMPEWAEGSTVPARLAENDKAAAAAAVLSRIAEVFLLKTPNLRKAARGDAMRDWMIASWLDVPFEREKERYALLSKVLGLDRGTLQNRAREVRVKAGEPKRKRGRPRKSRTSEDGR